MDKILQPEKKATNECTLTKQMLSDFRQWVGDNPTKIPKDVAQIIKLMLAMCDEAHGLLKSNQKLVALMRQYMGFVPSKEREDKKQADNPEWSAKKERELGEKAKKSKQIWKDYKASKPKKNRETAKKHSSSQARQEGQKSEVSSPSSESIFQAAAAKVETITKEMKVKEEDIPNGTEGLTRSYQKRTRYEVELSIKEINYEVETVQSAVTGFSKTATIDDGPARFRITWEGIAQLVLLIFGMCLPMVRLAKCLQPTVNYFNPSRIWRISLYAARAFAAIYLEIFRQLAQCSLLAGDDTKNVVLEMNEDIPVLTSEEEKEKKEKLAKSKEEIDPQKADLLLEVGELLGSQALRKDGKGHKKAVFTSVVIGQYLGDQPGTTLVFYHSERKTFGDLLGKILALRKDKPQGKQQTVFIQSDLSTSNIPNPKPANLDLVTVGCLAHARRPFWRFREDADDEVVYYCYTLLLLFDKIFDSDREARETGDKVRILKARVTEQKPLWEEILVHCRAMQNQFAPNSDMAKAADYITKNSETLTRYFNDARLVPDNNLCERLLRYKKSCSIIPDSALPERVG